MRRTGFLAHCSCRAGRRGRLPGPRIRTGRPDLRSQNRSRIPRLAELISVARQEGNFNDLRAQLGNDIAMKSFREGKLSRTVRSLRPCIGITPPRRKTTKPSVAANLPAGSAENIQFMAKDPKKYAAAGGWGFADFKDRKPASEAVHQTCFLCHEPTKDRDL